jgi:hypothetical protein
LNAMCSRKCAVPFVAFDSYRDPASIQTPIVAVSLYGAASVATLNPDANVVTCYYYYYYIYIYIAFALLEFEEDDDDNRG